MPAGATGGEGESGRVVPGVIWEWEGDEGNWSQYSEDHSRLLSKGLIDKDDDVIIKVSDSVKLKVKFDSMTQTNVKTGWQRVVRCTSSKSDSRTVWEWENEDGEWVWFSPGHQRLLQACLACQVGSVSVETSSGKRSRVDFGSMERELDDGKRFGVRCTSLAGQCVCVS